MFDCEPRGAAGHLPALCPGGCAVCTTSLRSDLRNPETLNQMWRPSRLVLVEKRFLTAHVGVVDDRFAPRAPAVVFVGAHAKLVGGVGFQVVDDGFAGWAGLVDPLPVPLSVADGVEPETRKRQITTWKRQRKDPRTTEGVPQGSVLDPQRIHRPSTRFIVTCSSPGGWIKDVPGCVADSSGEPKAKVSSEAKKKRRAQAGRAAGTSVWKVIPISCCQFWPGGRKRVFQREQDANRTVWQRPNPGSKKRNQHSVLIRCPEWQKMPGSRFPSASPTRGTERQKKAGGKEQPGTSLNTPKHNPEREHAAATL